MFLWCVVQPNYASVAREVAVSLSSPDNSLEITCGSIFSRSHCSSCPHCDVVQVWPLQVHLTLPLIIDPNHPQPELLKSTIYSHHTPVRITPVPSFSGPRPWFLTHPCTVRASGSRKVSVMASWLTHSPRTNLPHHDNLVSAPSPAQLLPLCSESPNCPLPGHPSGFVVTSGRTTWVRISLVVQWLRICLANTGYMGVRSLIKEQITHAMEQLSPPDNYWACGLQLESLCTTVKSIKYS